MANTPLTLPATLTLTPSHPTLRHPPAHLCLANPVQVHTATATYQPSLPVTDNYNP